MTDNEIIKALECCDIYHQCEGCPRDFHTNSKTSCMKLGEDIRDIINRQKAEIENLKEPLKKLSEIGYCHNFQLERSDLVSWIYAVCGVIKVVKEMTENDNGYNS